MLNHHLSTIKESKLQLHRIALRRWHLVTLTIDISCGSSSNSPRAQARHLGASLAALVQGGIHEDLHGRSQDPQHEQSKLSCEKDLYKLLTGVPDWQGVAIINLQPRRPPSTPTLRSWSMPHSVRTEVCPLQLTATRLHQQKSEPKMIQDISEYFSDWE